MCLDSLVFILFCFFACGCQLFQHNLLKRFFLLHWITFAPLSKIRLCLCESREFSWVYKWMNKWTNQPTDHDTPRSINFDHLKWSAFTVSSLGNTSDSRMPLGKGEFSYTYICRRVIWVICFSTWRGWLSPPLVGQTCVVL